MTELPPRAQAVVIGAGIVGNCLVGHLSRLGWTDMVLLDKGPLPNPGGSTGHASNFIFPTDHNKEMALLTLSSQAQYEAMGVNTTCGGIEVARTPERLEEFKRRMTSAKAWGIEASLLTPAEIKELVPFINEEILLGGFNSPTVSVVDSLRAGTLMREEAVDAGHLQVFASTEVLDVEVVRRCGARGRHRQGAHRGRPRRDRVRGVEPAHRGDGRARRSRSRRRCTRWPTSVRSTCSWSQARSSRTRSSATWTRSCTSGSRPGRWRWAATPTARSSTGPTTSRSNDEAALSPTELPFTDEDFDDQLEDALEIMGEILETAEIRYAINGLLSLTPDAMPVLGETVEVRNLWSAAAVWIKEGPGIAQLVAEWMTDGYPHLCDAHSSDITRFYPHEKTVHHIEARCSEHFNKTYGIVHPREQWASERGMRRSPFWPREEALGAVFFDARGWERPQWYESNVALCDEFPGQCDERPHEWDARWWSPITNAEHLALRVARRHGGPHRVLRVRHHRPRRARRAAVPHRQLGERAGRTVGLHAAAHTRRRLPLRPHDPAARRGALPGRHRRIRRRSRPVLVPQVPARPTAR